jgi:hypothetical protein
LGRWGPFILGVLLATGGWLGQQLPANIWTPVLSSRFAHDALPTLQGYCRTHGSLLGQFWGGRLQAMCRQIAGWPALLHAAVVLGVAYAGLGLALGVGALWHPAGSYEDGLAD